MSAPLQVLTLLKFFVVLENNFLVPVPRMTDEWKLQTATSFFFLHDNKQLVLIVLICVFSLVREGNRSIDQVNEAA